MAPLRGETLVLDEVQWAEDEERGSAWTRLMLGGEYRHILLLGAVEALPLVQHAFPDAEIRFFERKTPLDWAGRRGIAGLGENTVVVAFSRRAVIGLAGELNQFHPGRVAVLYGAMPLGSRREEIDRFIEGRAAVCAATDVLGHGVNLPCETLLFAETTKFDGRERRNLLPWEIAQIAGRAGRYGFHERGHVGVLTGVPWADPDPELVRDALDAARRAPGRPPRLPRRRHRPAAPAALRPERDPRGRAGAGAPRLAAGRARVLEHRRLAHRRVDPAAPRPARRRPRRPPARTAPARARRRLEADAGADRRGRAGRCSGRSPAPSPATGRSGRCSAGSSTRAGSRAASLEEAEAAAREASILRWFALQYPGVAGVTIEKAAALEEAAAGRVVRELRAEIADPTIGRCRACGSRTAPWATLCDRCFMARGYKSRR